MHEPDTLGLEREERSGAAMALLFFLLFTTVKLYGRNRTVKINRAITL
jgi:hypothetical protein